MQNLILYTQQFLKKLSLLKFNGWNPSLYKPCHKVGTWCRMVSQTQIYIPSCRKYREIPELKYFNAN